METYEYATLYTFETDYWWYRSLHAVLLDVFRALDLPPGARVLDMGCGTGQNAVNLARHITPNVFAFDISPHAAPFWKQRRLHRACLASINEAPYPKNAFDAVVSVDVLESDAVNEAAAIGEMWRVVKPGGYLVLVVPAYRWLLTEEHHRAVHASRRYSRQDVITLLERQPVRLIRTTHVFATLFPAIAVYRLALQRFGHVPQAQPRSELKPLPGPINEILFRITDVERRVLKRADLPFGSSILAVAQKVEQA